MRTTLFLLAIAAVASAQEIQSSAYAERQPLDDAWWTGPMLAPSASTLPRGHFLIEPYLYDVTVQGQYDHNGVRRRLRIRTVLGLLPTRSTDWLTNSRSD